MKTYLATLVLVASVLCWAGTPQFPGMNIVSDVTVNGDVAPTSVTIGSTNVVGALAGKQATITSATDLTPNSVTIGTTNVVGALAGKQASGSYLTAPVANASLANSAVTVTGTANQITFTGSPVSLGGTLTAALPQDIGTSSSPTFVTVQATTGGGDTFVVAAVDAPARIKAQADYVCDGVADDVQINAAIVAAYARNGVVKLSPGNFTNSSTITITNGVTLEGSGHDGYFFDTSSGTHRSRIAWSGSGGTMLLAQPSTLLLSRPLLGLRIKNIEFDAKSAADTGVQIESATHAIIEDVAVFMATNRAMVLKAYSNTNYTGLIHTYNAVLRDVILDERSTNLALGDGLVLDGDSENAYVGNGSTTLCTFENLAISHGNGTAINIKHGDTHTFINPVITQFTGGTGHAVDLWDTASGTHGSDHNTFIAGYPGGGGIYVHGTNTQPSVYGHWIDLTLSDLSTLPNISGSATFYYNTLEGTNVTKGVVTGSISADVYNSTASTGNALDFNASTTTSGQIRLRNNVVGVNGRNAAASADVELFRINSSDELQIQAPLRFNNTITVGDTKNFLFSGTTGTKFGTATTQKIGFWNVTPVVQPTSTTDLRTALINIGLVATGGASPLDLNGGALTAKLIATSAVAPTISSATTIAPTTPIVFISGTTAVVTITAPVPISSTGGQITLIPTGIFTTTTGGNIALASTAVVNKAMIMTYDATTTKWYPSY